MLDSCLGYLGERRESDPNFTFEVIVVDDGSKDRTPDVAFEYTKKFTEETIRVLKLPQNVGKGDCGKQSQETETDTFEKPKKVETKTD